MIYGHARVSTDGQGADARVRQLTKAGCKEEFRETVTAPPPMCAPPSTSTAAPWARPTRSASCSTARVPSSASIASADDMLEAAIEAGAENAESDDEAHEITCPIEDFFAVRDALETRFGPPESARLDRRPTTSVTLDEDRAAGLLKLLDAMEENDDVQNVYANFDIPEAVMQRLSS
jgi:hypothetical protein